MERKIEEFLIKWKKDIIRKPLLLYGPKQVGKTFSSLAFGKKEYRNIVYFNTHKNKELINIFVKEKSTEKIIINLSMLIGETILEEDTLIILDNVDDIEIIRGLKLFGSEHSKYHIIAITSHRDNLRIFKAEELQYKGMNELDFEEFLWAHGEKNLSNLIRESYTKRKTCPFHKVAMDLFLNYLQTGGMPEVVLADIEGKNQYEIEAIKQKIIDIYLKEVSRNNSLIDIQRGIEVIESIPYQLKKANKKFQYGIIGTGRRAKEYESSINYLVSNQLAYRCYKAKAIKSPLSSCRDKDSFKIYSIDDGILYTMLHMNYKKLKTDEDIKETLYENHIAKTLIENGFAIYYFQSEGKAEVNFIIQNRMGQIVPIEITTKTNTKAKSLSFFMKKYTVQQAFRITENNFATKKDIRYIPVYAAFCLDNNKI